MWHISSQIKCFAIANVAACHTMSNRLRLLDSEKQKIKKINFYIGVLNHKIGQLLETLHKIFGLQLLIGINSLSSLLKNPSFMRSAQVPNENWSFIHS